MSESIRVVFIDDHPLFREGVAITLAAQPDIEVVGQGENVGDAVRLARELSPDLMLLDVNIPGGGGSQAAQQIAAANSAIGIIMLTASDEEDDLTAALKAGARGYVLKGVAARELVGIVRSVHAGEGYVMPALAAKLLSDMSAARRLPPRANPLDALTERERQILDCVAAGLSNREVGDQLHLSEKTVKHYMTIIMEKLQVRNRVEAALIARNAAGRDADY